jgi:FixJ family two-component response regulator
MAVAHSHKPAAVGKTKSLVCLIDADELAHARLKELFESVGLQVLVFDSPALFLQSGIATSASCLVLDVRLPEMSGLKLQEELLKRLIHVPLVFVSRSDDVATAVRAMKAGAVDFLTKPMFDQQLLDAVFAAVDRDQERRRKEASLIELKMLSNSITSRERQVLVRVAAGKLNKQIAAELGVSEVMVKVHRANGMRKLRLTSVAGLVRAIDCLEELRQKPPSIPDKNTDVKWYVYCQSCGEPFAIMPATTDPDPFTPSRGWKGPCPVCGAEHAYQTVELKLGEEYWVV